MQLKEKALAKVAIQQDRDWDHADTDWYDSFLTPLVIDQPQSIVTVDLSTVAGLKRFIYNAGHTGQLPTARYAAHLIAQAKQTSPVEVTP